MAQNSLAALPRLLLPWYRENKRDLPWRTDREPYHIWLSEIMLQQTRVEAVKGYYARFLDALPNIEALAGCDDELLHKLWEGLSVSRETTRSTLPSTAGVGILKAMKQIAPAVYSPIPGRARISG